MNTFKQKLISKKITDNPTHNIDGVFGGILPNGKININFFVEAGVIPQEIELTIDSDTGKILEQKFVDTAENQIYREMVSSINMNLSTAKGFHIWLGQLIKESEAFRTSSK